MCESLYSTFLQSPQGDDFSLAVKNLFAKLDRKHCFELLVTSLPFFLFAPTQNFQDLEKSACNRDPKPTKPAGDPKSYRPISLLCVPYKIFERLIYARIEPLINPLLPKEQAGFQRGKSTVDQVVLLTQNIEDSFEKRKPLPYLSI